MNDVVLEAAFGGLVHDIGKFSQRALLRSDLSEEEKMLCPMQPAGYHSHLHSGYTSRFLREHLHLYNNFEKTVSEHHLPAQPGLSEWIVRADCIASAIDRSDEDKDFDSQNDRRRSSFQQIRLSSVFSLLNFGKSRQEGKFPLKELSKGEYSQACWTESGKKEAVEEYDALYQRFLQRVDASPNLQSGKVSSQMFDEMYALLYEFASSIPASTYEGNETFVSLFDHLKLTAAIASCLAVSRTETFRMLEFDVSGIQKFIFKVTEGSESKNDIAKSLRGRSLLISLITDAIMYSYLHEFGLTQANIIFQTGGGALLLLPDDPDFEERAEAVSQKLLDSLYQEFHTDITFVYSSVRLDARELECFKTDKAVQLKSALDEEKARKFSSLLDKPDFFF